MLKANNNDNNNDNNIDNNDNNDNANSDNNDNNTNNHNDDDTHNDDNNIIYCCYIKNDSGSHAGSGHGRALRAAGRAGSASRFYNMTY